VDRILATKSEGVRLVVRVISFQDFHPIWSQSTNVTDGRRDGQTDRRTDGRHAIPRPRICTKVHCAVTTIWTFWALACNFWWSFIVEISWLHFNRTYHHRKSRICRWNFDAICHSSKDITTSGFGGHVNTSGCQSLLYSLVNTIFYLYRVSNTTFVVGL